VSVCGVALRWAVRCGIVIMLLVGPALRAEEQSGPHAWVAALLRAATAGDDALLRELSANPVADVWQVLDVFHAKGLFAPGIVFTDALPSSHSSEALRAYAVRMKDPQEEARSALDVLAARIGPGQPADLAARIGAVPVREGSILAVRRAEMRAAALEAGGDQEASAEAHGQVGDLAAAIGWYEHAVFAYTEEFVRVARRGAADPTVRAALDARAAAARHTPSPADDATGELFEGGLLVQGGSPRAATPLLREAIAVLEKSGPRADLAQAHATLAQGLVMAGQYGLALHHSEAAQDLYEKLEFLPGVLYARAGQIATFSDLYLDEETIRLCEAQVREAAEVAPENLGPAWLAMAIAEARDGRDVEAGEHFEQAMARFGDPAHVEELALCLLNRGRELYLASGMRTAARRDFERARQLPGLSERLLAYADVSLADVLGGEDASAHAAALLQRALAEASRSGDVGLKALSQTLAAERALAAGEGSAAYDHARQAAQVVLEEVQELGSDEGTSLLGRRESRRAAAVLLAAAFRSEKVADMHDAIEMSRSVALLANAGGWRHLRESGIPPDVQRAIEEGNARFDAAQARFEQDGGTSLERARELKARVAEAETSRALARSRLEREARRVARAVAPERVGLAQLRAWLRPDEAFLHLVVVEARLRALVVTSAKATPHDIASLESLEAQLAALDDLRDVDEPPSGSAGDVPSVVAALAKSLGGPIDLPPQIRTVIVSPTAELANLPWPLVGQAMDARAVVVTPSASLLLAQTHEALHPRAPRLVVGISDYTRIAAGGGARRIHAPAGARLGDIDGAAQEAQALVRGTQDVPFLEEKATEAAVAGRLRAGGEWSVLHFACHGLLHPRRASLSSLALHGGEGEDGFLTVAEVHSLRLTCGLVVLSACDVGSMLRAPGEGYIGLPPAVLAAGGQRVLCHLWPVSDEAGRAFMSLFYASLDTASTVPGALRDAQARFRRQYPQWSHPYYWAGWTLWGTPR